VGALLLVAGAVAFAAVDRAETRASQPPGASSE
jgi:hypothetical protein